ncbi:unnamed protein product [Rhizophagus irregularis]|nr:unnamed protein product [Rhizophagus irregularis]
MDIVLNISQEIYEKIQEWCENCSEIHILRIIMIIYAENKSIRFISEMCSDCYLISFGWIKSTVTNKHIPIIYLPWWDASNKSRFCKHNLKFITDCQKWCPDCFIIYVEQT